MPSFFFLNYIFFLGGRGGLQSLRPVGNKNQVDCSLLFTARPSPANKQIWTGQLEDKAQPEGGEQRGQEHSFYFEGNRSNRIEVTLKKMLQFSCFEKSNVAI